MSAPRPAALTSRPDKRRHVRRDVIGSQLLSVDVDANRASALILDASEGGMALQLATPLKANGKATFSFLPPDQAVRIQLTGTPVWIIGDRVGISFSELDQRSRSSLKLWLASLPLVRTPGPVAVPRAQSHDAHDLPLSESSDHQPALAASTPPPTPDQESLDSIASRARILLCGTGAAVAWRGPEGMICRASDGNAPPTGVPVDINRGLSGECVRTGAVVRCDDTESDSRVDPEVCRQLRLRSAIIVPITGASGVLGLIEVFSDKPRAFSERDIPTLRTLAGQIEAPANARLVPVDTPPSVPKPPASSTPPLSAIPLATESPAPPSKPVAAVPAPAPPDTAVRAPAPPASSVPTPAPPASSVPAPAPPVPAQTAAAPFQATPRPAPAPPPAPAGIDPATSRVRPPLREPDQRPTPFPVDALRRTLSPTTSTADDERKPKSKLILAALIIAAIILVATIYWAANRSSASPSRATQATTATQTSDTAVSLPPSDTKPTSRTQPSRRTSAARNPQANRATAASTATGTANVPVTPEPDSEEAEEVVTRSLTASRPEDPNQSAPPTLTVNPTGANAESGVLASLPSTTAPALSSDMRVSRVSELKLVRRIAPKYPQSALLARRQGTVMLRLTVGSNGRVKDAQVLSGDEDFARAALDAVRQWRYQPYRLAGEPVEVTADAIITFTLNR